MQPLPLEREVRALVDERIWTDVVAQPLGRAITSRFADDTVRGVVATDALIGTFASMDDPSLIQNRCFLYHLIGNGTGEWRVPVGGMGAVTDALARAAVDAGAEIVTGAGVSAINPGPDGAEVIWHDGDQRASATGRRVLSGVAPWVLRILLGEGEDAETKPVGSQLKINFLLDRLPALRSGADPAVAFAGTLHLAEDYTQLERAYGAAAGGSRARPDAGRGLLPQPQRPLDPRATAPARAHTLTYFGLHTPAGLFDADPEARDVATRRALASLDAVLAEPIEACLARDADGNPCIEAKIPQDVEKDLAMPGGHIFHGDLEWPWAPNRAAARHPRPAVGRADRARRGAALRIGRPARRRGLRPRRPQRRPGRPRRPLSPISPVGGDAVVFYSLHRMRH